MVNFSQISTVSRSNGTTLLLSVVTESTKATQIIVKISPFACVGFATLILATVIGNTLVLFALFLDKRLHSSSFFLIANMAVADLLLGLFVLPFSSILEILNDRWIFGDELCSAWLAVDVLCCTASIIALMAVSVDRYIGVTRPLKYGRIMTTRRTIYLIIIVWTASILTSVVPLFGLTDRGKKSKNNPVEDEDSGTCYINKNTFYTIFSSMVSFYIPVLILLILYSRVYQEAKKQGEKLEREKRRLYQIDYQIASEQARQQENNSNGYPPKKRINSNLSDEQPNDLPDPINQEDESLDRPGTPTEQSQMLKECSELKPKEKDDISQSICSLTVHKTRPVKSVGQRIVSSLRRNSTMTSLHLAHFSHHINPKDELLIIRRKLHNLKREKKAFRTLVLIFGALLICWLPFFVTLPIMSILKNRGILTDESTENTWFKITFWLGYCNSALNPFVYAFSNRAIRRAFRQIICRRCCSLICCPEKFDRYTNRRQRTLSGSLTTDTSQIAVRRTSSFTGDALRLKSKANNELNGSSNSIFRGANTGAPVVSFADFLAETADDDNQTNKQLIAEATKAK